MGTSAAGSVLVAVAWPYANGPRHIGHVSGFGVPSDIFARYMRMRGHSVLMVSGTDEYGTPIVVQAEKEGVSPRDLADRYNRVIAADLVDLGLSYDLFTRTTTVNHTLCAQELFRTIHGNGYLVERTTRGAVSPSNGRTLPDRFVEGTCPICGYDGARGDQCDNCGNQLDPEDLINPRSRVNGEVPLFVDTEHFFLDLPALAGQLRTWLESHTDWRANTLKFSVNLLDDLKPRAMTRDINWGIPIPLPEWEANPNKRLYVWFDAVVGYLSASIEWARRFGAGPDDWRLWWNSEHEPRSYYFMGKDNVTFHTQIWPAELLAYDGRGSRGGHPGRYGELALPTEVVSSEYLTMEGQKFATSRGVVIYVRDVIDRYGPDALRYFIAAAGPESQDTDFTWAEFVRRNNDELVAGWGNLVHRSISMAAKYFGRIPAPGPRTDDDDTLLAAAHGGFETVGEHIEKHRHRAALNAAMRIVDQTNKYLSDQQPWKQRDDPERQATVLHTALQVVSDCNTLLTPFIPHAAQRVHELLGGTGIHAPMPSLADVDDLDGGPGYPVITGEYRVGARWASVPLEVGRTLSPPSHVFRKLEPSVVDEEHARLG